VSAELVQELERSRPDEHVHSRRARIIGAFGPLTMFAGVIWAIVQPYRLTILHPHGQGIWWLLSEPPLFVVIAGLVFWLVVAPSLIDDLEASP
jgi:hypothetical protein